MKDVAATLLLAAAILLAAVSSASSATLSRQPDPTWVANATVRDIVPSTDNKTAFIGGDFDYVGPHTGASALLGAADGRLDGTWPIFTGGEVRDIEPDVDGGWIVIGTFSHINGQAWPHIARVTPFGTLDKTWKPTIGGSPGFDGTGPFALEVTASSVYVGGDFTAFNGSSAGAGRLVRIDFATGVFDPSFTNSGGFTSAVHALSYSGSHLYVGGAFSSYSGSGPYLVRLDALGDPDAGWTNGVVNGIVRTLDVANGRLYAGGYFSDAGGFPHDRVAAWSLPGGAIDNTFVGSVSSNVNILVATGNGIYVAGAFTAPNYLTKLDAVNGAPSGWNPQASTWASGDIRSLHVTGHHVYVGGTFANFNGAPRMRVARFDVTTLALDATWTPSVGATVSAIASGPGDNVLLGGMFNSAGGVPRKHIAQLDLSTGEATGWNPTSFDFPVYAIAQSGTQVYGAGGAPSSLARIATASTDANVSPFTPPTFTGANVNAPVSDLEIIGSRLVLGGTFTYPPDRSGIIGLQLDGSVDTTFIPPQLPGVKDIEYVGVGLNRIYVGGAFPERLIRLQADGTNDFAWGAPSIDGTRVSRLAADTDGVRFLGDFGIVNTMERAGAAMLGNASNDGIMDPKPWSPINVPASNSIDAIELHDGDLIAGGTFTKLAGDVRSRLGATHPLDPSTARAWTPFLPAPFGATVNLVASAGSRVVVGGGTKGALAIYDVTTDSLNPYLDVTEVTDAVAGPSDGTYVPSPTSPVVWVRTAGPAPTTAPKFTTRTRAYDQYPMANPNYEATSGLDEVSYTWTSTGNGTWSPGDHSVPGAARGLVADCWKTTNPGTDALRYLGRRTDRNIDYYTGSNDPDMYPALPASLARSAGYSFPSGEDDDTSFGRLSCTWDGWLVGPEDFDVTYRVRTNGDNHMNATVTGFPMIDAWAATGSSVERVVPFASSEARHVRVNWGEALGTAQAALEWNPNPSPNPSFTAVPDAAFVTKAEYVQEFKLLNGATATGGAKTLQVGALDRSGRSVTRNITVNIDNNVPAPSSGFDVLPAFGWSSVDTYTVDVPSINEVGSGVESIVLERQWQDGLAGGACTGTLHAWTSVGGGPYLADGSVDFVETNLAAGCYQYRLIVTDRVGNVLTLMPAGQSGGTTWHKVDLTEAVGGGMTYTGGFTNALDHSVGWTTPTDIESNVSTTHLYRVSASLDPSTGCGIFSGQTAVGPPNPANPYTDGPLADDTCYQYSLRITNGAGDERQAVMGPIVKVDRTAPGATFVTPGPGTVVSGTSTPVSVNLVDDQSGIKSWSIDYDGPEGIGVLCGEAAPAAITGACTWNTTTFDEGTYTLTLHATDRASNSPTAVTRSVTVDNVAPITSSVRLTELLNPVFQHIDTSGAVPKLFFNPTATGSFRAEVDATDAGSGVQRVDFWTMTAPFWLGGGSPPAPTTPPNTYGVDYSWGLNAGSDTASATATDFAGRSTSPAPTFAVVADSTVPTGGSVDYPDGVASLAVVTVTPGVDTGGSGMSTHRLLRRSLALDANQACPVAISAETWNPTGMPVWDPATPLTAPTNWTDTSVQRGRCYQYALQLSDNVGNVVPYVTSPHTYITDAVGLVVTPGPATSQVSEAGGAATWMVSLRAAPTANVAVMYVGDGQAGPATTQTTVFTSGPTGNWGTPRPITIGAVDDQVDEPTPHTGNVRFTMSSADVEYDNALPVVRSVSIVDNDKAGISVSAPSAGVAVAEPGTTATYNVKLTSEPHGPVTVTLGHGAQATAAPTTPSSTPGASANSLTFTSLNWGTGQSVTVTAVNDPDVDGTQASTVTNTVSAQHADDDEYTSVPVASVGVSIADDDVAGFELDGPQNPELSEADPNVVATVRARLRARPASDVTLTWGTSGGQVVPSAPLVFTPANWDQWQVSTIRANNDTVAEPPLQQLIGGASLTSADPHFAAVAPITGPVTIRDDDAAVFVTSHGANWTENDEGQLLLDESATSGSVLRIRAVGDPTSDIVITPEASPAEQLVISPPSQKILAGSHEQVVTFSVRAVNDREKELDPHPAKVTWKVATGDVMYGAAAIPVTVARIKDGDGTTTRENTPDPKPDPTPDTQQDPTPTPDPGTTGTDNHRTDDAAPQPGGDASGDDGDDAPGNTVGDDGSAGDDAIAGSSTDEAKRTTRAAKKTRNPATRLKNWAGENKGKASVAASAAGTAALWGAKPLALAGKALMSGGGGVPGHPPGMGQVRHLFKRKFRAKVKRFWRGKKRDLDRDDEDDWDDFLWGDRAA